MLPARGRRGRKRLLQKVLERTSRRLAVWQPAVSGVFVKIEEISEPIRVLADCSGGELTPVRFRWSGRTYVIGAVNGRWIDRGGDGLALHYSVQVGDETYYLHFAGNDVQWWLDRVVLEG